MTAPHWQTALTRRARRCAWLLALCWLGDAGCASDSEGTGPNAASPDTANSPAFQSTSGPSASAPTTAQSPREKTAGSPLTADSSFDGADAPGAAPEADFVERDGDRLYVLSNRGTFSIVGLDAMPKAVLLGHAPVPGTPIEMYVRDGVVIVLSQELRTPAADNPDLFKHGPSVIQVIALNVEDPAAIVELARMPVGGTLLDSRLVGDILFVASDDPQCGDCADTRQTSIVSFDLTDPTMIAAVDTFQHRVAADRYRTSPLVRLNDRHAYIGAPLLDEGSELISVDLSDPDGVIHAGAPSITMPGYVSKRWQLDEYDGVLRVLSQSFGADSSDQPRLLTFEIDSEGALSSLAETRVALASPRSLESVRFDGPRGYVVSKLSGDPIVTLDLSDPARPRQVGEFAPPGVAYHLHTAGERLLVVGFTPSEGRDPIRIAQVDTSSIAAPVVLDEVRFGGEWAWLFAQREDMHKAMTALSDQELILLPFSFRPLAGAASEAPRCDGPQSGLQLIDWRNDTLRLRGVATSALAVQRGLVHEQRLFSIGDKHVESFDVSDRDAPRSTAFVPLTDMPCD